jgi:reactive intermediate/imine deaminase
MPRHIPRPDGLPPGNGYSHVTIAAGPTVYVSGQVPVTADGVLVGAGDATAQAEQVFTNLDAALRAAHRGWSDVVKLTFYLTDLADLPAVRAVRDRYLDPDRLPASSLVKVAGLVHPDFRIEIDAVASIEAG